MGRRTFCVVGTCSVLGVVCAGCGTTTIKTTTVPAKSSEPTEQTHNAAAHTAGVGSTIALTGFNDLKMNVKVTAYKDPVAGGEFDQPQPGTRFVGVMIQMTNTGNTAYDDAPSNGASLITTANQEADSAVTLGGSCESPSLMKIAPGSTRVLCLPFEVRKAQKGRTFQFTLDSGFSNETGEWTLR